MKIAIIGAPFCLGTKITGTEKAPYKINVAYKNPDQLWGLVEFNNKVNPDINDRLEIIANMANKLSSSVQDAISQNIKPIVLGGDHSIAIGTWTGVTNELKNQNDFGLIWIDAHLDAHTFETSPSKNYHGMPLSFLLGIGDSKICEIGGKRGKINPKHLVIIGARSYEDDEHEFLKSRNVKIFYMDEVKERGFEACFQEAVSIASGGKRKFGVSIDLDYFSPDIAPGVGTPEINGGDYQPVKNSLTGIMKNPNLAAFEIVEYNTELDIEDKTANLIIDLLEAITL